MKKGFTLIELLLVMSILGAIIMLVIRHQTILNYKTIYAGYEKKATEDVINAANLVLIKNPGLKNFSAIANDYDKINVASLTGCGSGGGQTAGSCARDFFKTAIRGNNCDSLEACKIGGVQFSTCKSLGSTKAPDDEPGNIDCRNTLNPSAMKYSDVNSPTKGIRMKNGEVIMFSEAGLKITTCNDSTIPCLFAYVDMNGKKDPNTNGQDRYRFKIYKNHVERDDAVDIVYVNTNALTIDEKQIWDQMSLLYLQNKDANNVFTQCFKSNQWSAKATVSACKAKYNVAKNLKSGETLTENKNQNGETTGYTISGKDENDEAYTNNYNINGDIIEQ